MPDDDSSATERLTASDRMLADFLRAGLRPAEIAVRLRIPVAEVHGRIERLEGRSSPEPAVATMP
ncbi:MAG: hypothetical protein ACRDHF_02915, partial [Tepidiformaceae bacterium]